jgi:hypothetical protein
MDIVFLILLIAFLAVFLFVLLYIFVYFVIESNKGLLSFGPGFGPSFGPSYGPGPGPSSQHNEEDNEFESEYRPEHTQAAKLKYYKKSYDEIQRLIREGGYEIYHKFAPSEPINKESLDYIKAHNHSLLELSPFEPVVP